MKLQSIFCATVLASAALPAGNAFGQSATDLANALHSKELGSKFVRVRMQTGSGEILQLQIKSRVSAAAGDIVYQVLFPKERKGQGILLRRAGEKFSGTLFNPPATVEPLAAGEMKESLLGSDLSYEDIIDSPFRWSQQAIVGTESIDNTACQILESKPGKDHRSSYASVKTWIDPRRFVPLRIEKFDASGKLVRRVITARVLLDG